MHSLIPRTATKIQFLVHRRVPGTSIYPTDRKVTISASQVEARKFLKMPEVLTPIGYFSGSSSELHLLDGANVVLERNSAYTKLEGVLGRDQVAALAALPGFNPESVLSKMGISPDSEDVKIELASDMVAPGADKGIDPQLIDALGHDIANLLASKGFSSKSEVVAIKQGSVAKVLGLNVKNEDDATIRDTVVAYIKAG